MSRQQQALFMPADIKCFPVLQGIDSQALATASGLERSGFWTLSWQLGHGREYR
jgi:hypothetical protein